MEKLMSEHDLIHRVKEDADSDALMQLVGQHSGIYFSVVSRYAATYPAAISYHDMADDKLLNVYRFVMDYDESRGKSLCGYINDRTDYLCRTILTKSRNGIMTEASETTQSGVSLVDETDLADVAGTANADLGMEDILKAARDLIDDARFIRILKLRHFTSPVPSWRAIGVELTISHERARQVYQENLDKVRRHLGRKA